MANINPISPKQFFSQREVIAATAGGLAAVLTAIVFATLLATHQPIGIIGFSLGGAIEIVSIATLAIGTCLYLKKRKKGFSSAPKTSTTSPTSSPPQSPSTPSLKPAKGNERERGNPESSFSNEPKKNLGDTKHETVLQKPENKTDDTSTESDKKYTNKEEKLQSSPLVKYCEPEEMEEDKLPPTSEKLEEVAEEEGQKPEISSPINPFKHREELTAEKNEQESEISPLKREIIFINPFVYPDEEESKPSLPTESVKENNTKASTTSPSNQPQITEAKPDSVSIESDKIPLEQNGKPKKSVTLTQQVEEITEELTVVEKKEFTSSLKTEEQTENGKEESQSPLSSPKELRKTENGTSSIEDDFVVIEKEEVKEKKVSTPEDIETIRESLGPLYKASEELFIGFLNGYYKCESKSAPTGKIETIKNIIKKIHTEIDGFLKNPLEMFQATLGFETFDFIDGIKLEKLKNISEFPECLKAGDGSSEEEFKQIKEIMQTLCSQFKSSDKKCNTLLITMKKSYQNLQQSKKLEEEAEKKEVYKAATVALVDHLYMKAKNSKTIIKKGAMEIITLSFLEKKKTDLFSIKIPVWIANDLSRGFEKDNIFASAKFEIKKIETTIGENIMSKKAIEKLVPLTINKAINEKLENLPLTKERKNAIHNAVKQLIPIFLQPIICAVSKDEHPFHQKFKAIVKGLLPPKIKDDSWKGFSDAYSAFLNNIAQELQK